MPHDLKLAIVSVPVADQTRARDFYRDKLGFAVVMLGFRFVLKQ